MPMSGRLLRPRQTGRYAALRSGLVAYWPLNETAGAAENITAVDWTNRGNNLTSNNTVPSTTGLVGNARQFLTANNEFLSIANRSDIQFGEDAWTFALWLLVPASATGAMQVFSKDSSAVGGRELELNYNRVSNTVELSVYCTDDTAPSAAQILAGRDAWTFIAATHALNSDTVTLRVNASTATTVRSAAKSFNKSATDLRVGARVFSGFTQPLTGNVDEVAKWSRALSSVELDTLYNSGAGIDLRQ